jgi:hypothetical protein
MAKSPDLVDRLIEQLRAAAPDYPLDKLQSAALLIRRDMGGATAYVKKAPAEGKAFRLGTALAVGVSVTQAFADLGVSRATGYRLLASHRRWRCK